MTKGKGRGWHNDSKRHSQAARGIKTAKREITMQDIMTGKARRQLGLDTSDGSRYDHLRKQGYSDFDAQAIVFKVKKAVAVQKTITAAEMERAKDILEMITSSEESLSEVAERSVQKALERMEDAVVGTKYTGWPLGKQELKRAYDYVDEYLERASAAEDNKMLRLELDHILVEVKKARRALGGKNVEE